MCKHARYFPCTDSVDVLHHIGRAAGVRPGWNNILVCLFVPMDYTNAACTLILIYRQDEMKKFILTHAIVIAVFSTQLAAEQSSCSDNNNCYVNPQPLVVSATRWETSGIPTASSITIITHDEIVASGASRIIDVLKNQAGIQIRDLYGDGSRASVDMRGFGESAGANTLILVDGRRLNTTDSNGPNLQLISLKDVERIEITEGSASVLYGDQAVGGVINIITRQARTNNDEFEFGYGSYDHQTQLAGASHNFENGLGGRISVERLNSDNYRDNNKLDYLNGYAQLSYDWNSGHVFTEVQRTSEETGIPGALFANQLALSRRQSVNPLDFNDTISRSFHGGGRFDINSMWSLAGDYTYRDDDVGGGLTIFGAFFPFTQSRQVNSWNPRIRGMIPLGKHTMTLIAGADIEHTDYNLISPLGIQDSTQNLQSVYTLGTLSLTRQLSVTAGIRRAWLVNDITDTFRFPGGASLKNTQTATTIGLTYTPSPAWRLYLKREDNYRFPLVDEETNFFSTQGTLKTQTGVSYEAGAEWHDRRISTRLAGYILNLDNELVFDPITFQNLNLDKTQRDGLIYTFSFSPRQDLIIDMHYTYTNARFASGQFDGNRVPLVAEHELQTGINWQFTTHWNVYAEMFFISDRIAGSDFGDTFPHLAGYGVTNLHLHYQNKGFFIAANFNNILDKKYSDNAAVGFTPAFTRETAFYPAPERNIFLTLGYQFD